MIWAHSQDVRLHGCRAFGEFSGSADLAEDRAVVEQRLEQAAEESSGLDTTFPPASRRE